ncbi:MAG: shikimate dehydrogenase [Roseimicrobium sp.]
MSFLPTLTGSFSQPAADNPTVAIMEAAYAHHGLDFRYLNTDVPPSLLADAVRGAKAMGFVGFNCSLPHKVAVIEHLDGLAESARIIGAVNCAVKREGQWMGENTDGKGFLQSLVPVIDPAGQRIVVLGAGGAARAIAVELALAGAAQVTIVNRTEARGRELAALVSSQTPAKSDFVLWQDDYTVPAEAGVLVNATSIGLAPRGDDRVPVVAASLQPYLVVADVIPNPPRTVFLREAEARGCRTLDGLGMLVNQAATNFEFWTGVKPDKTVMQQVLERVFGAKAG